VKGVTANVSHSKHAAMDMDSDLDVLVCPTVQVDGRTYRVQSAGAHFSYQPPPRAAERAQLMMEEEEDEVRHTSSQPLNHVTSSYTE